MTQTQSSTDSTGYIFTSPEHGAYSPAGKVAGVDAADHNAQLTRMELAAWALQPADYCGYVTFLVGDTPVNTSNAFGHRRASLPRQGQAVTLTTWTGELLGQGIVTGVFRNNLTGSRTVAIRITGTNGATYTGRFGDEWSQLCRIRRTSKRITAAMLDDNDGMSE